MEKNVRPLLLESLCYLSFAGNTFRFFLFILPAIFFPEVSDLIISVTNIGELDGLTPVFFIALSVSALFTLLGVYRLWCMKKDGLVVFFIGKAGQLSLPVVWTGWQAISVTGMIFAVLFMTLFLTQIKKLS